MRFWVLVVLAGCYKPTFTEGLPCSEDGNCPEGQMCEMTSMTCNGTPVAGDGPGIDVPMGDELLLALAFEGFAGGEIQDQSSYGNNAGLAIGGIQFGDVAPNLGNGAIWQNGDNGILVIDDAPELDIGATTGALTVSLWIDSDMIADEIGVILERPIDTTQGPPDPIVQFNLEVTSDVYRAIVGGSNGSPPLVCRFSADDSLHHFAFTYDSVNGFTGYLDGEIASTVSGGCDGTAVVIAPRPNVPIRLGRAASGGEGFIGKIDNLRIYNRVLTQAEIQVDMVTPIP